MRKDGGDLSQGGSSPKRLARFTISLNIRCGGMPGQGGGHKTEYSELFQIFWSSNLDEDCKKRPEEMPLTELEQQFGNWEEDQTLSLDTDIQMELLSRQTL